MNSTPKQLHLKALDSLQKAKQQRPVAAAQAAPPFAASSSSSTTPKQSAPPKQQSKPKVIVKVKPEGPVKNISIQHMSAPKAKPLNKVFYDVLSYLKVENRGVPVAELADAIQGYDLNDPAIASQLQANPKILFEEGMYYFKPLYPVKNMNELLELANKTPNGLEVEQLKDSYKTVEADLKTLAEQKEIIIIRNEESKHEMVYPNYSHYRIAVSEEFLKLWRSIKTPGDVDLEKEMRAAGIASTKEEEVKAVKRPAPKKKEARTRKITNITNKHILSTGVDIMKTYAPVAKK